SRPCARAIPRWGTIAGSKPPMRSNQYQKNDPMPMWRSSNHICPSVTTSRPASSWSRSTLRVASTKASWCSKSLNASMTSRPWSWCRNQRGRGYEPTIVVGSSWSRHSGMNASRQEGSYRALEVVGDVGRAAASGDEADHAGEDDGFEDCNHLVAV